MFTSVMWSPIVRPKRWIVSPHGITAVATSAVITLSAGARTNTTLSACDGMMSSFMKSLMPSAIVCRSPNGPTRSGPIRSCMCPITFRSIQTMSGTPSRMKPRTMWTLIAASISVAVSTRLLQLREEAIDLLRRDVFMVAVVHHEDRRRPAGAETLDGLERELAVLRRFPVVDGEALLDLALEPVPSAERARKVAAYL